MMCTKKLLEAFERSQKARADRVIRRHSRPGVGTPIKPDIGDGAMPLSSLEGQHYDTRSVLAVAGAWLLLYVVMAGNVVFTQAAKAFAAFH